MGGGGGDDGVDLSQPQTFTAYGDLTKKSGYWRTPAGGGKPAPLIWADKSIGGVQKAKDADRADLHAADVRGISRTTG